jgi:hypothetical protein
MPASLSGNLDVMAVSLLEEFGGTLRRQMKRSADELWNGRFDRLLTPVVRAQLKHGMEQAECDGLAIYLLDDSQEALLPVYRQQASGPDGAGLAEIAESASVRKGVPMMVCASGQPICDNGVQRNPYWGREIDALFDSPARDLIVTPLRFAGRLRGVIAFVRSEAHAKTSGSSAHNFNAANLVASTLEPLIDHHLASMILRWE